MSAGAFQILSIIFLNFFVSFGFPEHSLAYYAKLTAAYLDFWSKAY